MSMTIEARRRITKSNITPLVLTYNEEPNIWRTLESLQWAERVVVLDSGSTDLTMSIAKSFSNVEWRNRKFDNHQAQWEHGVGEAGISTDYVLALDADMSTPPAFVQELQESFLPGGFAGGVTPFVFQVLGRPLYGSIYPAQLRVFRRTEVEITQQGHTQEFSIEGNTYRFKNQLIHDDRKALERWVSSQLSYSILENERLKNGGQVRFRDKLRRIGVMPPIAAALAYIRAGGPFRGPAAARYAYERAAYECLLAIRVMSSRIEKDRNISE